jgi:Flp pilus assembly protein TadB
MNLPSTPALASTSAYISIYSGLMDGSSTTQAPPRCKNTSEPVRTNFRMDSHQLAVGNDVDENGLLVTRQAVHDLSFASLSVSF